MSKDFRIKQLRTSQIIVSGSAVGTSPSAMMYSASAATDVDGNYNADLLRNVGTDVWYFVSGSKHSVSGSARNEVVLFGGDVVISGTLFAEKQVIEVDLSQTSDLFLSGAIVLGDQSAGANTGRAGLADMILNNSGSLFMATGSLFLATRDSGTYTETVISSVTAGNGLASQLLAGVESSLNLDINSLSGSLTNSNIDTADLFAVADVSETTNESKKITLAHVAAKLAGAGLASTAGVVNTDISTLTAADIDVAADLITFHDTSGTPATKKASIGSLIYALTGSGVGRSASNKLTLDINALGADGNAGNLSDAIALADASDSNVTKKITITQLKSLVDTDTTYTAGDGLDLSGTTFSTDLKANGGLLIDSTEIAIDDSKVATLTGSDFSGVVIASNSLTASFGLHVAEYIRHIFDANTHARFQPDLLELTAGGIKAIKMLEDVANSVVEINPDSNTNLDFVVKTVSEPKMINVNAGLDYISIGDDAGIKPDMHLYVSGWNGGAAEAVHTGVTVFEGDVVFSGSLLTGGHGIIDKTSLAQNGTFGAGSANVPVASGTDAVAIGLRAKATGNYSLAIGSSETNNTDATAAHSLAIGGDDATASGAYASAIGGSGNTATGQYSVAMGRNTAVAGNYSVAIGDSLVTYDNYTTILGSSTPANAKVLLSSSLEVNQAAAFKSDLDVAEKIRHDGDTDTYLKFEADRLSNYTGGIEMLDMAYTAVNNRYVKIMKQGVIASGVTEFEGNDISFYVSGTIGSLNSSTIKGTALFGGDVMFSGSINTTQNISTSGSLVFDANTSIVRDGNDLKFDDGNNTVKTLTQLASTGDSSAFHLGVHGGSNDSKMASSASFALAGTQGADHYTENIGSDVLLYVSGGFRSDTAAFGKTASVFAGGVVFSGSADFFGATTSLIGVNALSLTGSQSLKVPLIIDGTGAVINMAAQKLSIGASLSTPDANSATLTINKNTATQAAAGNVNNEFQILLKNLDDGDNSFSGIAFDSGTETDPDSIGAAIRGERDSTAGSNMALHDTNLTFATNDGGDGGLTERMRITHDGIVEIAGGTLAFGNGQNAAIDVSDVSGTDTAGKTLSILGGASTGTGAGGQIEFKVTPPAGSTGAGVNSHLTLLTLPSTGVATFAGSIQIPNGESLKNGDGESVITIDANQNVTVLGDLTVAGNDIKDASGNTALTFDGTSGNITNAVTFSGTQIPVFSGNNGVKFANNLIHDGDTDTKIAFTTDQIDFTAGGVAFMILDEDTQNKVVFNEGGVDVDFRIESSNEDHMFFVDGATDRIGIGIAAPSTTVEIKGATADQTTLQLKDSASSDVIVKMYHLSGEDDGIIDVLANNVVTARINSNGVSMLGGDGGSAAAEPGLLIVRRDSSTAADDLLGAIGFDSSDGNVPSSVLEASAFIAAYAAEDHSANDKGGYLSLGLSIIDENDDVASTEIMRITGEGAIITGNDGGDAALKVIGRSSGAHPLVKIISNDTEMDANQALLEINSEDTTMGSDNFWVEFTQGGGSTIVGSINSEVAYTTFTGQHPTKLLNNQIPAEGSIIISTGNVLHRDGISNAWVETTTTTKAKDKAVVGVYRGAWTDNGSIPGQLYVYNAIGEGQILVTDIGGNIEVGDYICSSIRSGHGMLQDDDLLHNYTVAKATEAIDWSDIVIDASLGFKSKLVACTYHSG